MGRRGETTSYTNASFEEVYTKKLDAIKVELKSVIYGGLPFVVSQEYACKKCAGRIKLHADGRIYCLMCEPLPANWSKQQKERVYEILRNYPDIDECAQEWEAKQIKPYVPPQEPRMPKAPEEKAEIDEERREFGHRLKAARKDAGMTIESLAKKIKKANGGSMSYSSIQMYESGATYPPENIMAQLVNELGRKILEKTQEAIAQ